MKAQLTVYFEPQKNKRYEVYHFPQTTQPASETLDQYHTRLRTMAQTCELQDVDFEIEEEIIIGGSSSRIRKWALRDPTYNLAAMLLDGRRDESSTYEARKIEEKEPLSAETNQFQQKKGNTGKSCRNCGGNYSHKGACPAKGKQCRKCLKTITSQLYAEDGPQKRKNQVTTRLVTPNATRRNTFTPFSIHETDNDSSSDSDDCLYSMQADKSSPKVNVKMLGHKFKMTIDTGATVNLIDRKTFQKLKKVTLQNANTQA